MKNSEDEKKLVLLEVLRAGESAEEITEEKRSSIFVGTVGHIEKVQPYLRKQPKEELVIVHAKIEDEISYDKGEIIDAVKKLCEYSTVKLEMLKLDFEGGILTDKAETNKVKPYVPKSIGKVQNKRYTSKKGFRGRFYR